MVAGGPPLTDKDRRKVTQLHAQGLGRNEIARRIGRARSTVSKLAAELGLRFDRADTLVVATQARVADAKARRAQLASDLLNDAQRLREQLWAPCTIHNFGGKDNTHNSHDLDRPLFADQLKIMQAAGLAAERHARLIELDADTGVDDAKDMLAGLMGALAAAWRTDQTTTIDQ